MFFVMSCLIDERIIVTCVKHTHLAHEQPCERYSCAIRPRCVHERHV